MEYQINFKAATLSSPGNSAPFRPPPPYRQARLTPPSPSTSTPVEPTFPNHPSNCSDDSSNLPPAYRRAISLPPELESTTPRPAPVLPQLGPRRRSICFRQRVTVEELEDKVFEARLLLSDLDATMKKLEEKRMAMEEILDRAERQLEDHAMYFDGRYPPALDRMVDVSENKRRAREQWSELRLVNASVRFLKDDITPLPYADGRMPKHFPKRLAGLMNLTERQVDGLLFGYGQNPNKETFDCPLGSSLLDSKRRFLAAFIGIDLQAVAPFHTRLPTKTPRPPTRPNPTSTWAPPPPYF